MITSYKIISKLVGIVLGSLAIFNFLQRIYNINIDNIPLLILNAYIDFRGQIASAFEHITSIQVPNNYYDYIIAYVIICVSYYTSMKASGFYIGFLYPRIGDAFPEINRIHRIKIIIFMYARSLLWPISLINDWCLVLYYRVFVKLRPTPFGRITELAHLDDEGKIVHSAFSIDELNNEDTLRILYGTFRVIMYIVIQVAIAFILIAWSYLSS